MSKALFFRFFSLILTVTLMASTSPRRAAAESTFMLQGFPLFRQQHPLTCESSAASMATRGALTETQLMNIIPRNPNPNLGFRGNPNNYSHPPALVDYGVYAAPVQKALLRYGYRSTLLSYATPQQLASYIASGKPVVAWITYQLLHEKPRLAWANNAQFVLVNREHAILLVGYSATHVIGNDPWTAKRVTYTWSNFLRSWGYFGNMALAIEPCPAPSPVSGLSAALLGTTLTWSWNPAAHANRYDVTVVRRGSPDSVIYHAVQASTTLTIGSINAGVAYRIAVTALSPCNGTAGPSQLSVMVPALPPTPIPTVTSIPTPPTESALTPSPTVPTVTVPTAGRTATIAPPTPTATHRA